MKILSFAVVWSYLPMYLFSYSRYHDANHFAFTFLLFAVRFYKHRRGQDFEDMEAGRVLADHPLACPVCLVLLYSA